MDTTALRQSWADGATALGAWLSSSDPIVAEAAGGAGFHYVCIDMQHGTADYTSAWRMLQGLARSSSVPLVRVPWNEPGIIGRMLDAGALGIIIPMVNSPEEAEQAVASCRYAPAGSRSFGPLAASLRHGGSYATTANEQVLCIPMIETRQAVERIDEILEVPGIDAVYVGPADLSLTLGLPGASDQTSPVFHDALAAIVDSCRRHGIVPGIHASAPLAQARHGAGFRMITVSSDIGAMGVGMRSDVATAGGATAPAAASPAAHPYA